MQLSERATIGEQSSTTQAKSSNPSPRLWEASSIMNICGWRDNLYQAHGGEYGKVRKGYNGRMR